jgi:hypothetical protein
MLRKEWYRWGEFDQSTLHAGYQYQSETPLYN